MVEEGQRSIGDICKDPLLPSPSFFFTPMLSNDKKRANRCVVFPPGSIGVPRPPNACRVRTLHASKSLPPTSLMRRPFSLQSTTGRRPLTAHAKIHGHCITQSISTGPDPGLSHRTRSCQTLNDPENMPGWQHGGTAPGILYWSTECPRTSIQPIHETTIHPGLV